MAKKISKLGATLKKLLFYKDMRPVDLAREVNLPPPTIHRLITGKSARPYKSSLQPIADFFSVTIEQLVGEEPLPDIQSTVTEDNERMADAHLHNIPLIPFEAIRDIDNMDLSVYNDKLFVNVPMSEKGFATILQDSSMEPIFSRGSILIFDPKKNLRDRSYVLVQLHEKKLLVFRQLLIDLDQKYLKPLNPDLNAFKMRLLTENDVIVAVLVEARHVYSES